MVKMTISNEWKYSSEKNCMVVQSGDTSGFQPLPRTKLKSSSAGKPITIKVKSEALPPANNLEHTHDTRCRKKKSERRLIVEPPPLNLPNHVRTLALFIPTVQSPTKSPQTKKSKSGEGYCICSLKSKFSDTRCVCKNGLSCSECRSCCCSNVETVPSSAETQDTESSDLSAKKSKDSLSNDISTGYRSVPFPSLDNHFTSPKMKNVSPISVT